MSYILEALKKVEQQQHRDGIARLLTVPPKISEEGKKGRVLAYVVVGALILNALVMAAWWMMAPRQRHETITSVVEPGSLGQKTFPEVPEKVSASTAYAPVPDGSSSGPTTSAISEKSPPFSNAAPATSEEGASGQKHNRTAISTVKQPINTQPRNEVRNWRAPSGDRLLDLRELPPAVRGNLPEFRISGHAYNPEPRFRVARVNNKIVQEGEALSQGLKVDEIVQGGVIFTYQGYRFRVGINDNP